MAKICSPIFANEIDGLGDTVTVRVVTATYTNYGDKAETYVDTTGVKSVVNDISPEEQNNKEGKFMDFDKHFYFKGTQTGIANGNEIIFNSRTYRIIRVVEQRASGTVYLIEAYGKVV